MEDTSKITAEHVEREKLDLTIKTLMVANAVHRHNFNIMKAFIDKHYNCEEVLCKQCTRCRSVLKSIIDLPDF